MAMVPCEEVEVIIAMAMWYSVVDHADYFRQLSVSTIQISRTIASLL